MKHAGVITAFTLGLALGILGPFIAPRYLLPHLPQTLQGRTETVEGIVTRKQKEADQLLLTSVAPRGATLVTFKDKAKEIDMLVEQHDTITLSVRKYEPFLFDPKVTQVKKPQEAPTTHLTPEMPGMHSEAIPKIEQAPKLDIRNQESSPKILEGTSAQ